MAHTHCSYCFVHIHMLLSATSYINLHIVLMLISWMNHTYFFFYLFLNFYMMKFKYNNWLIVDFYNTRMNLRKLIEYRIVYWIVEQLVWSQYMIISKKTQYRARWKYSVHMDYFYVGIYYEPIARSDGIVLNVLSSLLCPVFSLAYP